MRFEWNLSGSAEEFIDSIAGDFIDFEEGSLLNNYLVGTDGFSLEDSVLDIRDGRLGLFRVCKDFPSGIVMIRERYLTPNSSGYRAIFSDEDGIYDEWDAFVEESRRDYDE